MILLLFQKGAQYLHKELPRRIARRIKDFQSLPYVAAINPTMQEVVSTYVIICIIKILIWTSFRMNVFDNEEILSVNALNILPFAYDPLPPDKIISLP